MKNPQDSAEDDLDKALKETILLGDEIELAQQAKDLARMVLDYFGDYIGAYPAYDKKMIALGFKAKEILKP